MLLLLILVQPFSKSPITDFQDQTVFASYCIIVRSFSSPGSYLHSFTVKESFLSDVAF